MFGYQNKTYALSFRFDIYIYIYIHIHIYLFIISFIHNSFHILNIFIYFNCRMITITLHDGILINHFLPFSTRIVSILIFLSVI